MILPHAARRNEREPFEECLNEERPVYLAKRERLRARCSLSRFSYSTRGIKRASLSLSLSVSLVPSPPAHPFAPLPAA